MSRKIKDKKENSPKKKKDGEVIINKIEEKGNIKEKTNSKKKFNNSLKDKKNIFQVVCIIVITVIIVGLLIVVSKEKDSNANNHIQEISYAEYQDKITSDEYTIVLLASPVCSHCMAYKPLMNQVADKYNLNIYYLNVNSESLTEEEYINLHDSISVIADNYNKDGEPVIPTPATVIYRNGKEMASELGNIKENGFLKLLIDNGVVVK